MQVFRFLPFKVVFVQFDQKIGDALVFNHTLKLEIDFFSHSSKNSQEWAGKTILKKRTLPFYQVERRKLRQRFSVQSSRSLNRWEFGITAFVKKRSFQKAAGKAMRISSSGSTVH